MFPLPTKLTTVATTALAAAMFLGFDTPAAAGPPEGLRYSDWQNSTGWFAKRPSYSAPRFSAYIPPVVSPGAVTTEPGQATVAIRGPDGVVRTYPVVGGVQQSAPAFVSIRGNDGVVRSYPVVNGVSPVITDSGVVSYPCHPRR